MPVPNCRIQACHRAPVRGDAQFVLYWMTANRRLRWNYALDRACEWAEKLGRPLIVLEALRCDYRWASVRLHRFILQGMADNQRAAAGNPLTYFPYVEELPQAGRGLLAALAERACVVVTDDFPCFFLPRMTAAFAARAAVLVEQVDSNGLWPMRQGDKVFARAVDFRWHLQRELPPWLSELPRADPWQGRQLPRPGELPAEIVRRWPPASSQALAAAPETLARLPIDQTVGPALLAGGSRAGQAQLQSFLDERLPIYHESRSDISVDAASGLSPYLHFGHISAHQVFAELAAREEWRPDCIRARPNGAREGWWGMSPAAENFLDECITWRELGYNFCARREDYDQYESLPEWAQATLAEHAGDPRPWVYSREQLAAAQTHDPLWNAAQTQLVREGRLHNYLRMLWGKKILEWSPSPAEAWETLIELNNRFAVDGRNPNSYSGIGWSLGRYDRPWGPKRPIFGTIRYMSSGNTARKFKVDGYLAQYGGRDLQRELFDR